MSSIRVNTGVKKIEVNDAGEYIILNFADQSFPKRYFDMLQRVQERAQKDEQTEKEIKEKIKPVDSENELISSNLEPVGELIALNESLHRYIMAEVDSLFGPDTCLKVFGDIVPSIDLFNEFFTQLMPFFEEYSKSREAKMNKYNAARMGNV